MVRKNRLWLPGYWYHVYSRGQRKNPIFFSPADYNYFLNILNETFIKYNISLGTFCLMRTHYHMLVRMGNHPLSKALHLLHTKYACYFNRKRKTVGHVLQGRAGAKIILNDTYLNQVISYIHQNPSPKNKRFNPLSYRWSSSQIFLNGCFPGIRFGCWTFPPGIGKINYNSVLKNGFDKHIVEGDFVGTTSDWSKIEQKHQIKDISFSKKQPPKQTLDMIANTVCTNTKITVQDIIGLKRTRQISGVRHTIIIKMHEAGYSAADIARYLNRSRSAITQFLHNKRIT